MGLSSRAAFCPVSWCREDQYGQGRPVLPALGRRLVWEIVHHCMQGIHCRRLCTSQGLLTWFGATHMRPGATATLNLRLHL